MLYRIEASSGARHFYHFDEMGDTAFLTGDNGALTDSYATTPYGEIFVHTGTSDNPFTWQGEFGAIQAGTNLYYMRDRYYDAISARFLSRDSNINLNPLSSEPYTYANGNPMYFVDPYGDDSCAWYDIVCHIVSIFQPAPPPAKPAPAPKPTPPPVTKPVSKAAPVVKTPTLPVTPRAKPAPPPPAPAPPAPVLLKAPSSNSLGSGAVTYLPQPVLSGAAPAATMLPTSSKLAAGIPPASITQQGDGEFHVNALGQLTFGNSTNVVSNDGGSIISQDGSGIISQDGSGLRAGDSIYVDGRAYVISNDGGSIISQDGSGFTISLPAFHPSELMPNPSSLLGNTNALLQNGASIISDNSEGITVHGGDLAIPGPAPVGIKKNN